MSSSRFLRHRRPNVQQYLKAYVNEYFPYHKPEVTSTGLKVASRKGAIPKPPFPLALAQVKPYGTYESEFHAADSKHNKDLVRVEVKKLCLNKFLLKYYYQSAHFFAHAGDVETKPGDMVLIEKTPEPLDFNCVYRVVKRVFSDGEFTDPVTGLPCYGGQYRLADLQRWAEANPPAEK